MPAEGADSFAFANPTKIEAVYSFNFWGDRIFAHQKFVLERHSKKQNLRGG